MKKFVLVLIIFIGGCLSSYSQSKEKEIRVHHEIDSLKKILPSLKDSDRVDCLNTLAHKYLWLPLTPRQQIDSSSPWGLQANSEAKRIGYKKGLGYSYLRMAGYKTTEADINFVPRKKIDTISLNIAEKYLRQAIQIGEELHDNVLLGGAYWDLGYLTEMRYWNDSIGWKNGFKQEESYIRKAISYHNKDGAEMRQGNFREQGFVDCAGCIGNERWLGGLYYHLSQTYNQRGDDEMAMKYGEMSIPYYEKAGETELLAKTYVYLVDFYQRANKYALTEAYLKKAIDYFQKMGNEDAENKTCISLCWYYISTGDFEKGFPVCERSIQLTEKLSSRDAKKQAIWGTPYFYMSRLYRYAGDYETALSYLYRCKIWFDEVSTVGNATAEIGDIHRLMKNYDSAIHYLKPFDTVQRSVVTVFGISILGNLFIDLNEYDKAISLIKESIKIAGEKSKSKSGYSYTALAKAYLGKKNYPEALKYAREAQSRLKIEVHKIRMMDNYEVLSQVFHYLKKSDSAYYYLKQFTALKDSLLTRQFYWRLSNYKKAAENEKNTSQIQLLNRDNLIKSQQLKQETLIKKSLIVGLIGIFLLVFFIYRSLTLKRKNDRLRLQRNWEVQRLESEKQHSELQQRAMELEMQALRAQMNPHFIFNCLSSINRFIIKNETEVASDYLTRFSRLIRMVLIYSQQTLITLEDELEMLRLYLDLERMRFENRFDYFIEFKNTIEPGALYIPSLLLQPFCENAIWHGLMHKEGRGVLQIVLSREGEDLLCTITDNGIGREKAAVFKSKSAEKEKSLGLGITANRLALLNRNNGRHTVYEIEDLRDKMGMATGTRINLRISCREAREVEV